MVERATAGKKAILSKRFGRRREYLKRHPDHESTCHICSDPELLKRYLDMSRSPQDLRSVLLSCGMTEYPDYSIDGERTFNFKAFDGLCCRNRCQYTYVILVSSVIPIGSVYTTLPA